MIGVSTEEWGMGGGRSNGDVTRHRRPVTRRERFERICREVAAEHGVCVKDMLGASRFKHIVAARHEAIARCYEETHASMPTVGRWFHRDHTSVLNAIRRHHERRQRGEV